MADISKIKYDSNVIEILNPDNTILKYAKRLPDYYADTLEVQRPVSGGAAGGYFGEASSLPVAATQVADAYNSFQAIVMNSNPIFFSTTELIKLDTIYDKRNLKITESMDQLMNKAVDYAVYKWCTTKTAFQTAVSSASGLKRATGLIANTGGIAPTNSCYRITYSQLMSHIIGMRKAMKSMQAKIYCLIGYEQFTDLLLMTEFTDVYKNGAATSPFLSGEPIEFLGVTFLKRVNDYGSIGAVVEDTGTSAKILKTDTKDTVGGMSAAKDQNVWMFFTPNAVQYAMGYVSSVIETGKANYEQGTVIQTKMHFGASIVRTDEVGVSWIKDTWVTT